jgi:hypothetical protein
LYSNVAVSVRNRNEQPASIANRTALPSEVVLVSPGFMIPTGFFVAPKLA